MTQTGHGKLKIIAIIASLAGLAIILSPLFPALQSPNTAVKAKGADLLIQNATFIKDDTVVHNINDEDLKSCESVSDSIHDILGVRNDTVDNRKVASDTLLAEFCSRPVLIHEIMASDYKGLTLVSYACDASSGKIGTAALQDSLSEFGQIYCINAKQLILNESATFLATVDQFRTQYLPVLGGDYQSQNYSNSNNVSSSSNKSSSDRIVRNEDNSTSKVGEKIDSSYFNVTTAENTLDKVTEFLNKSIELVNRGEYYEAAKSFDNASKTFIGQFKDM